MQLELRLPFWLYHFQNTPLLFPTDSAVDLGNFLNPAHPLSMLQVHDFPVRPVEMIGNKGYLLVQTVEGVASYSPTDTSSTSNSCSHLGQATLSLPVPLPLILW